MESSFNRGDPKKHPVQRFSRPDPNKREASISCRATNPLSLHDDLGKVFLDENQARATTATRMFRNDELFDAMRKVVLPSFFSANRSAKFCMWSTGCSSGEEVYSMAMIALELFATAKRHPFMEAYGTDINRNRIIEAREGVYLRPARSAIDAAYWRLLASYATMTTHEIGMGDVLRQVCKFTIFDMRNRPKKHTFHFIVCNHVLQYYDAPGQQHIIANLKSVLKPGGFLYLEGLTNHGLDGSGLKKHPSAQNLFIVAE